DESADVVVLSHELWLRRFGGDPSTIGRTVQLNGRAHEIIGVMPPGAGLFIPDFASPAEAWTPFVLGPVYRSWQGRYMAAVARLRPGVSHQSAQTEMRTIAESLVQD